MRRFAGSDRLAGVVAGQGLAQLYHGVRRDGNDFRPSCKVQSKTRLGAKVTKVYPKPATRCARLLLWRAGEARPTQRTHAAQPHTGRTRKDAFEGVWSEMLLGWQEAPEATAKALCARWPRHDPGRYTAGQRRTLQRRIGSGHITNWSTLSIPV